MKRKRNFCLKYVFYKTHVRNGKLSKTGENVRPTDSVLDRFHCMNPAWCERFNIEDKLVRLPPNFFGGVKDPQ